MLEVLKQLALDAVDKESLSDFCLGTVTSVSPLTVKLEEGLELSERFLILAREVTDHEETGRIRIWTGLEGDEWYYYRKIRNRALQEGETVILAKAAGGQQYMVLDRAKKGGNG